MAGLLDAWNGISSLAGTLGKATSIPGMAMGAIGGLGALFSGPRGNPMQGTANKLYDEAKYWKDANNDFYTKSSNTFNRNMQKNLNANVGFDAMSNNQKNGMYGMSGKGSALLSNQGRKAGMVNAFQTSADATENFATNLYGKGMDNSTRLFGQGADTEARGAGMQYENNANMSGQFMNMAALGMKDILQWNKDLGRDLTQPQIRNEDAPMAPPSPNPMRLNGPATNQEFNLGYAPSTPQAQYGTRLGTYGTPGSYSPKNPTPGYSEYNVPNLQRKFRGF